MDKELKARWVEALRSDRYKQTMGRLRTFGGFCCWGVLCDLVDPDGWEEENLYGYSHRGDTLMPAYEGCPNPEGKYRELAEMNDNGISFREIADVIEAIV